MRIGQRFFGLAQLASQPRCFIYFISFFHANYFTISATAILPNPPHHGVLALDVVFTLHGTSTPLACFHLPYQLHFETFAVTNHVHDTSVLSFQSTNLFQDGTPKTVCHLPICHLPFLSPVTPSLHHSINAMNTENSTTPSPEENLDSLVTDIRGGWAEVKSLPATV